MSSEWISWIRVNVGGTGGSMIIVDYIVRAEEEDEGTVISARRADQVLMDVYLPSFALPVGRLEVVVEDTPGQLPIPLSLSCNDKYYFSLSFFFLVFLKV